MAHSNNISVNLAAIVDESVKQHVLRLEKLAYPEHLAPREDGSCDLHKDHGTAHPLLLQAHHVFPQEYQLYVWGEVRVNLKAEICGTGHDSTHVVFREFEHAAKGGKMWIWRHGRMWLPERNLATRGWGMFMEALKAEGMTYGA